MNNAFNFLHDLRAATRALAKAPGFALAAIATLALGMGFVTSVFTVINGVAYGRLPFDEPASIVAAGIAPQLLDDIATQQTSFDGFAAAAAAPVNVRAGAPGAESASRQSAAIVTSNFLDVLRVRPVIGRAFLAEDALPASPRTALIGHAFWREELKGDPGVIGKELRIDGAPHSIVGVLPAGFGFPERESIWIPQQDARWPGGGIVFGRLADGVDRRAAAAELSVMAARLAPESERRSLPAAVEVVPFTQRGVKDAIRNILKAVLGATFLVLLLACANVANLVLARAAQREKEYAVRAALGATRRRLVAQMLAECCVLAALGALGGAAIAKGSVGLLWSYLQREAPLTGGAPFWVSLDMDWRVALFVALAALAAAVVSGLAPALQASRPDVNERLKSGGGSGLRIARSSRWLINAQMALSVSLVAGAALFATVLGAYNSKTLPYEPREILTARVYPDDAQHSDAAARNRFFAGIAAEIASRPGVAAVGLTSAEMLRADATMIEIEGVSYMGEERPASTAEFVSAGCFDAFGARLTEGRAFADGDGPGSKPVAIVNAPFAARYSPGRSAIGRRFRLAGAGGANPWIEIVGVSSDIGSVKAGKESEGPAFYRPLQQGSERTATLVVRTTGDAARIAPLVRAAVAAQSSASAIGNVQAVQSIIEMERIGINAIGALFIVCGIGALLLATVGVYAVVSFSVRRRTRELGLRMALGADRPEVVRMLLKQGMAQIAIGLGLGVLISFALSVLIASQISGLGRSVYDAWIYLAVVALLGGVGAAAVLVPALRGSRLDPMAALRNE